MLYSGTDPESYITEYILAYEEKRCYTGAASVKPEASLGKIPFSTSAGDRWSNADRNTPYAERKRPSSSLARSRDGDMFAHDNP